MRDAAGDSGEFYTPRPVVRFMVEVTNPRLGETVLDPACGTGGFLIEAFLHLERQADTVEKRRILQEESFHGGEAKPLPFLLSQMNLLLHGLDAPRIDPGNALRFTSGRDRRGGARRRHPHQPALRRRGGGGHPGQLPRGSAHGRDGAAVPAADHAAAEARRARALPRVVVPNGTLFGDGVCARIKADLLEEFNLHTIVRLPNGVFAPYTDIPTNLLFFDTQRADEGHLVLRACRCRRAARNTRRPRRWPYEEFAGCLAWWNKREENERAWKVSAADLIQRDAQGRVIVLQPRHQEPTFGRGRGSPRAQ